MMLVWFYILVCLTITSVSGATVRMSGSSSSVELGATNFRFTCTVTDDTVPTLGTVRFYRSNKVSSVSTGDTSCTPSTVASDPGYNQTCGGLGGGVFYLDIASVALQDEATWTCERRADRSNNVSLSVYYGPFNNPTLSPPSPQTVVESSTLTVDCSASCKPTCSYTWKRGSATVSSSSRLNLSSINRTQAGDYVCTARNTLSNTSQSTTLTVTVQYKPVISGVPPITRVTESSNLQIRCSNYTTPGNPDITSYRWTGPGGYLSSGSVLNINNITRNQTGSYTCTAYNTLTPSGGSSQQGTDTGVFLVNVQYKPVISGVLPITRVIESANLQIRCSDYTTPGNPDTTSYRWTGPGSYISSASVLNINNINRNHAGSYTCTAYNTLTPSGGSPQQGTATGVFLVDVQYKPVISGVPSTKRVTELSSLSINCSDYTTPGNPDITSYRWTGPGGYTSSGSVLNINNITRNLAGSYTCTAYNTLTPNGGSSQQGTASGLFQVDVQYPATITAYTVNGRSSAVTVSEGEQVIMRCQVDSNPNSTVTLYNTTTPLTQTHEHIWRADCRQRGDYSCQAGNNIGDKKTARIKLLVICSPRVDASPQEKYAAALGDSISLSVSILSYPPPTVVWSQVNNTLRNLSAMSSVTQDSDILVTTYLNLTGLTEGDFGQYTVRAENGQGDPFDFDVQLNPLDKPSIPRNLTILNKTSSTVTVAWQQGFNGGSSQEFTVQYSTDDQTWISAGTFQEREPRDSYIEITITDLSPQTVFYVRVVANNEFGQVETQSITALTEKSSGDAGSSSQTGVVVGVVVGVVLILIVVIIAIFLYRRGLRCQCVFLKQDSENETTTSPIREQHNVAVSRASGASQPVNHYAHLDNPGTEHPNYSDLRTYQNVRPGRTDNSQPVNFYEKLDDAGYEMVSSKPTNKNETEKSEYENTNFQKDDPYVNS